MGDGKRYSGPLGPIRSYDPAAGHFLLPYCVKPAFSADVPKDPGQNSEGEAEDSEHTLYRSVAGVLWTYAPKKRECATDPQARNFG